MVYYLLLKPFGSKCFVTFFECFVHQRIETTKDPERNLISWETGKKGSELFFSFQIFLEMIHWIASNKKGVTAKTNNGNKLIKVSSQEQEFGPQRIQSVSRI